MEDNSSASSDSDNALLAPKDHTRMGRNAATQTPEMPRHEIKIPEIKIPEIKTPQVPELQIPEMPFNTSSIMVYKLDTQKPMSELEADARNLAIPDVVVEYIRGSCQGETNSAFETQELIVVRTPSTLSLRDDLMNEKGDQLQLTPLYGDLLCPGGVPSRMGSTTSLRCPSPSFGYRPLESETSAIYTIIAPVKYVEKETEVRLLAQLQAQLEKEKTTKRKFEFCQAPLDIERRRHRLQTMTDICSTMFLIPGILIAIVTPVCLIPMFMLPLKYMISLMAVFIISGCIAVLSLAVSGFVGNIVWHYDDRTQKMRPKLHCGKGPLKHFWGNGFYPLQEENVLKPSGEKMA